MEVAFLEWLSFLHCRALDIIMLVFTYMGEVGALWVVVGAVLIIFKKTRRGGFILAAAFIADVIIINLLLKNCFARVRPFEFSDKLKNYIIGLGYKLPDDYSFPSGHSAISFCAAAALLRVYGKKALPALIVAALIAFSRLYIGVHYPTDVLCGAALGSIIGVVTAEIGLKVKINFKKFKKKKASE